MASLISTNQIPYKKTLSSVSIQNGKVSQTVKMNLKPKKHEQRRRVVKHSRAMAEGDHDQNGLTISTTSLEKEGLTDIDLLKKQLVDSFYGTNRGFCTSNETRAEITELISRVEAQNPNPAPTEALTLLNGKWILAYTSFHEGLIPMISSSSTSPPFMKIDEISQTIDSDNFTVENSIVFSGPLATTSISTNAKFQVRSPKRVQIKFEEGVIATPQLIDWIVIPENVEFLGQSITVADLTVLKSLLTFVQNIASSVTKTISSQPPLRFPISDSFVKTESWLLTTYLDDELRILRDDGGNVFALIKECSPLLLP